MFFRGRVENNKDPKNLQRLRLRVLGVHSFKEEDIPSDILPWAEPSIPITAGRVNGGAGKFDVPDVGDWVHVYYEEQDIKKNFPFYFGIIRAETDSNPQYIQGENCVDLDRWGNFSMKDTDQIHNKDKWGNDLLINKDIIKLLDHFKNLLSFEEKIIKIKTANGNTIVLDDENEKIEIRTPKNYFLSINDKDKKIELTIGKSTFDLNEDGQINIFSKDGKNDTINFNKLMMLFNTHTHTLAYIETTPPKMPMNVLEHGFASVAYMGGLPKSEVIIKEGDEYDAELDPAGTEYLPESIHPSSPKPTANTVTSTKLKNGSVNPSTDEYEGILNTSALPPRYTGTVVASADYYRNGKITKKNANLVKIQGKVVDEDVAKILYQMIQDSQLYNMEKRLKYIEKFGDKYKVTEKGTEFLKDENDNEYKKDDIFRENDLENYLNNKCPYSLVVINSGFRSGTQVLKDNETKQILCTTQLELRRRNQKRVMTEDELLNAKSSEFSPPTAKPHYSKHECGVAVDLNTKGDGQLQWLKNNASKYGFRQTIPSEAWHFEFFG